MKTMRTKNLLRGAAAASLLASSILPATTAQAAPKTTHATQLSIAQKGNQISGNLLGGEFSIQGNGLTAAGIPTIAGTGVVTSVAATPFAAAINTAFSYVATARTADTVNSTAAGGAIGSGTFADQEGKFSTGTNALGTIAISTAGAAGLAAGTGSGSTATAIISANTGTGLASTETRRVATSTNDQELFTADSQAVSYTTSGDGITAITAGGVGTSGGATYATGAVIPSVVLAGGLCAGANCAAGGAWNLTHKIRAGQAGAAMSATPIATVKPAYGSITITAGGTTAGALVATNISSMSALGGGAGTSSSLSLIQEMTTFGEGD